MCYIERGLNFVFLFFFGLLSSEMLSLLYLHDDTNVITFIVFFPFYLVPKYFQDPMRVRKYVNKNFFFVEIV